VTNVKADTMPSPTAASQISQFINSFASDIRIDKKETHKP